jgi:uncharacterized membrane protein HdeD (DUF308 family)
MKSSADEGGNMTQAKGPLSRIAQGTHATGIALIGLGVLSALLPAFTGAPVMILIGVLLLLAGLVRGWFGWRSWSEGQGPMGVVLGGLAAACGLAVVANPVSTLQAVASLVAAYMVLDGISSLFFSGDLRDEEARAWVWGDAAVSVLLGASMWLGWPLSGVRALGVLLGAKLVSAGAVLLRVGRGMRRVGEVATTLRTRRDG